MRERPIGSVRVAAAYIGTVVGAGFASGQELLRFFSALGWAGTWGILLTILLFVVYGFFVLESGRMLRADSQRPVLLAVGGPTLGTVFDIVSLAFLFSGVAVMIAGSAAIVHEQLRIHPGWGAISMAAAIVCTVLGGMRGLLSANVIVVPTMLIAVVSLSAVVIGGETGWSLGGIIGREVASSSATAVVTAWPIAAVLYTSYNVFLAIGVLAPLGGMAGARAVLLRGAAMGGVGLGVAALALHGAILSRMPEVTLWEVPLLFIAQRHAPVIQVFFTLLLWAEIYTTAAGSLYGLAVRLSGGNRSRFCRVTVMAVLLALGVSRLGFVRLVSTVFPVVGVLGLGFMALLPVWFLKRWFKRVRI